MHGPPPPPPTRARAVGFGQADAVAIQLQTQTELWTRLLDDDQDDSFFTRKVVLREATEDIWGDPEDNGKLPRSKSITLDQRTHTEALKEKPKGKSKEKGSEKEEPKPKEKGAPKRRTSSAK